MEITVHESRIVTRTWVAQLSEAERTQLRQELDLLLRTAKALPDGNTFSATHEFADRLLRAEVHEEEDECECCG